MVLKKKPEQPIEVSVASVDPQVEERHSAAVRKDVNRQTVILAIIAAVVSVAPFIQAGFSAYWQNQTRIAVEEVARVNKEAAIADEKSTKEVAETLSTTTADAKKQLDKIQSTGEANHDLQNSFVLALKKKLAERSRKVANLSKSPEDVAIAEADEEAYEAHRLTDERMRAEKTKQ